MCVCMYDRQRCEIGFKKKTYLEDDLEEKQLREIKWYYIVVQMGRFEWEIDLNWVVFLY